jgi:hypothetical protein
MTAMPANTPPPGSKYEQLIAAAKGVPTVSTIVAYPCDESSLRGAVDSAEAGIIRAILVGPSGRDQGVAAKHGLNITGYEIVSDSRSAAPSRVVSSASIFPPMEGNLSGMVPKVRGAFGEQHRRLPTLNDGDEDGSCPDQAHSGNCCHHCRIRVIKTGNNLRIGECSRYREKGAILPAQRTRS